MHLKHRSDAEADPRIEQAEAAWPGAVWGPPTDVFLTDDAVLVRVELAGVAAGDIHVQVAADELVVWGVRREPPGPRPRRIDRIEIAFGPFERHIPLPALVEPSGGSAQLSDGLLEVLLPLTEPARVERGTVLRLLVLRGH